MLCSSLKPNYGICQHGRREFSVLLAYQMDADKAAVYGEGWNTEYSLDQFELDFDIFEPR